MYDDGYTGGGGSPGGVSMSARARLEIVKGAARQTIGISAGKPATIGRSKGASLQILSGPVSRLHCQLQFDGKRWLLTDLDSKNGTWIGGQKIRSKAIEHGTIFLLGKRVAIRFQVVEAAKPAPVGRKEQPPEPVDVESCSFCGEPFKAGVKGVPGAEGQLFHPGCLDVSKLLGVEIGGVRIIERVGGTAHVHQLRAHQPSLSRHVLLFAFDEETRAKDGFQDRLLEEVRAVSKLLHPRILQIHDLVEEKDATLVVTEQLPGPSLREILTTKKFVKVPAAMTIASHIVDGLACAEGQGLLVDRLFPDEIFVNADQSAKLDYFRPPVARRMPVSSLCYIAPEVVSGGRLHSGQCRPDAASGEAATKSAIYSMGAITYHMLAGIAPHEGKTEEELLPKILRGVPPSLSRVNLKVSPALARVVERSMHKDPANRPTSFAAFQTDLKKLVSPAL
jgi:serine/threonine protein kinase